jgi:proteic killer suppression protein
MGYSVVLEFRHKGLERFFISGDTRGIAGQQAKRLRLLLGMLVNATSLADMGIAGILLHPLKADLKGFWAVNVSGNWRLVFRFDGENATDIDLIDCH